MAQVGVLDEEKYGKLLGKHRPRLIQSDEEFDRLAAELEALDAAGDERELHPEERELQELLAHLPIYAPNTKTARWSPPTPRRSKF